MQWGLLCACGSGPSCGTEVWRSDLACCRSRSPPPHERRATDSGEHEPDRKRRTLLSGRDRRWGGRLFVLITRVCARDRLVYPQLRVLWTAPFFDLCIGLVSALISFRQRRRNERAWPKTPSFHHIDLRRVQRQLSLKIHPRQQPDHQPEDPVNRSRVLQRPRDQVAAHDLQYLPYHGRDSRADEQFPPRDVPGSS